MVVFNGFFPAVWILFTSLKTEAELVQKPITWWPANPMLDNYVRAFTDQPLLTYLKNSLLVATGGQFAGDAFAWLLLLNPADVFRILNVFSLEDVRTLYGLASVVPTSLGSPAIMGGVMLIWIAAPLILANWRFKP